MCYIIFYIYFLTILLCRMYNDVTVDICSYCIFECHTHVKSSISIHSAMKLLKSGKNVGFDGLTWDLILLNASSLLYEYLSFLFASQFFTFHLLFSTIIYIPK